MVELLILQGVWCGRPLMTLRQCRKNWTEMGGHSTSIVLWECHDQHE